MKNATSWTKETRPIPKKRGIEALTKIKQLYGIKDVDTLRDYIKGDGGLRLIQQMRSLRGAKYVQAWCMVADYFLPKLQRLTIDDERPQAPTINNILINLSIEDRVKALELLRSGSAKVELPVLDQDQTTESIPYEEVKEGSTDQVNRGGEDTQTTDNETVI